MTSRRRGLALVVVLSLTLCGCSAAAAPETAPAPEIAPAPTGGTVELAVSETCTKGSDPQCIPVGDQHVMRPSAFEPAAVADAVASGEPQQNALEVTFTAEGAAVLHDLSDQAAPAGDTTRLVLKVGDEILGAAVVMEALPGDQLTIALPPEHTPEDVLELLRST